MESRLVIWWGEANRLWGLERETVLDKGFYPVNKRDRRSSGSVNEHRESYYPTAGHRNSLPSPQSAGPRMQHFDESPSSSLGLYHAPPPSAPLPQSATLSSGSNSSSGHLITPGSSSSSRTPAHHTSAPIRSRADSISLKPQTMLPSPPRRDSRPSVEIPKLAFPPFRESVSYRQTTGTSHYSPERDQPRDRRSPIVGGYAPRDHRHQPYARPTETTHTHTKQKEPSSGGQWEPARDGAQCLGIAALVSAAEERSKERLLAPPGEVAKV